MTITPPSSQTTYGFVICRIIQRVGDGSDVDGYPDAIPASGTIRFRPLVPLTVTQNYSAISINQSVFGTLNDQGILTSGAPEIMGIWLVTGQYQVTFEVTGGPTKPLTIEVTEDHTLLNPLDLATQISYIPPPGVNQQVLLVPAGIPDGFFLVKSGNQVSASEGTMGPVNYANLPAGTTLTVWYNNGWPPRPTDLSKIIVCWCSIDYQGVPPSAKPEIDFIRVMEFQPIPNPDPDPPIVAPGNTLDIYTFESDVNGSSISPSSPWSLGGSVTIFTASSAATIHGSMGGRIERLSGARWLAYTETTGIRTRVVDCYFRLREVTGAFYLMQLSWDNAGVATNRADVRINADRTVSIRDALNAVGSSGEDQLVPYEVYRASWHLSPAGQRLRIVRMSDNQLVMDITGSLANASAYRYQIGMMGGTVGTIVDYDTIRIGDDWIPFYV